MALSKLQLLEVLVIAGLVSLGERGDWVGAAVIAVVGGGLYALLRARAKESPGVIVKS